MLLESTRAICRLARVKLKLTDWNMKEAHEKCKDSHALKMVN
jgi:hypothetical protein